ncbi:MAG: phosphoribosylformylglycinamidine cyclo-ligase [Phycisphaerales bacterium]
MPRPAPPPPLTYAASGVNLQAKDRFTDSLESVMRRTHTPRVIRNPGGFAGLFRLDYNERLFRRNYKDPVLVACTDGCGTKVKLAAQLHRYDTIGIDLVAMNVNDLIVQGAEPLFFLDYIAVGRVDSEMLSAVVRGVAEGCKRAGCSLIGGETAEMPGVYHDGDFDLAGFAVGVVELKRAVNPTRVKPGDIVLGLGSDGIHSNGYTLVRKVVETAALDLNAVYPELIPPSAPKRPRRTPKPAATANGKRQTANGKRAAANGSPHPTSDIAHPTLGHILLTPTRLYAAPIVKLQRQYTVKNIISGMAHITGSGMAGNLERALHKGVDARIDTAAWPVPPVFRFLQHHGDIPDAEMRRVFNMGIGYTLIVRPAFADSIAHQLRRYGERVHVIGTIVKGTGAVRED